jgi:hypothetical protein
VRWKEPRAFAATDHTARHPHQGGGRSGRRRVGRQCRGAPRPRGSLIHHAAACTVGALPVPMIEAALGTLLMPSARGADRALARLPPTPQRAVDMPAVASATDREGRRTGAARAEAQRRIHRVAALRATARPSAAADVPECRKIDPARRSAASVSEGPEVPALGPHLAQLVPYPTPHRTLCHAQGGASRASALRAAPAAPLDPPPRARHHPSIDGFAADRTTGTIHDAGPELRGLT